MEPSLSPILITIGLVFAIHAILIESISDLNSTPPPQHASPRRHEGTLTRPPPPPPPRRLHNRTSHRRKKHPPLPPPPPPPPRHENKLNTGKKIGLLFAGFASILQIGVVGFLVFKRRQLLTIKDRYETCST